MTDENQKNTEERKFWMWLRQKTPMVHWQRIETTTGPGVPDINGCYMGKDTWIELKINIPKKGVLLRKEQYAWITKRNMKGGRIYVLAWNQLTEMCELYAPPLTVEKYANTHKYVRVLTPPKVYFKKQEGPLEIVKYLFADF